MTCRMSISAKSGVAEGTGRVQTSRRFMPILGQCQVSSIIE